MSVSAALERLLRENDEVGPLREEQVARLCQHGELLLRWNRVHNLTRITAPEEVASAHFLDSLLGLQALADHLGEVPAGRMMDVGSGGGFPGLVAAVLWPELEVTLVEAVKKKASFLSHASRELGLANLKVEGRRSEELSLAVELVTTRATLPWPQLPSLTEHLRPGGALAAWTGHEPTPSQWRSRTAEAGMAEGALLPYGQGILSPRAVAFARRA